jgi:hypothetical protein
VGISARSLAKKFEMEELVDYQDRSRREIDRKRGFNFTKIQYLSERENIFSIKNYTR